MNELYSLCAVNDTKSNQKFSALYTFQGLKKIQVDEVEAGDIIALAGVENISIGDTISDNEEPMPLPRITVDEPTVSMLFYVNNSPFAGKDGKFLKPDGLASIKATMSLLYCGVGTSVKN